MRSFYEDLSADEEREHIERIRKEASDVKDCFTKFSFQAIASAGLVLTILASFGKTYTWGNSQTANASTGLQEISALGSFLIVATATAAIILLLLAVARIGTHKYGTANRNYGYQLHLERTKYADPSENYSEDRIGWQPYMRKIGWEDALLAWRVVQATVFEEIYESGSFSSFFVRSLDLIPNRRKKDKYFGEEPWFEPTNLIPAEYKEKGVRYHAGSYLQTMLLVLHALALISFLPLVYTISHLYYVAPLWQFLLVLIPSVLAVMFVVLKMRVNTARREILESGLLCINSCAIMWQVIVVAHYNAVRNVRENLSPSYIAELSKQANLIKGNYLHNISAYIDGITLNVDKQRDSERTIINSSKHRRWTRIVSLVWGHFAVQKKELVNGPANKQEKVKAASK